jgi:DNA repair/transcription protein MET18/MMS19
VEHSLIRTAQTLTRFYLSKLDDFDSLSPTLNALIVLSKQSTFDDEAATEVYKGYVLFFVSS